MATEDTQKPAGDDPFSGWAEALDEQRERDAKLEAEQGGPLTGEPVRPYAGGSDVPVNDINMVLE